MANKYLGRDDAPFGEALWKALDTAMISAAKSQLVGRRLLDIEGPYGLGLKSVPTSDAVVMPGKDGAPEIAASKAIPLALVRTTFTLAARDLASFEHEGPALDLGDVARAAMACARLEDELVFNGSKALGVPGLLASAGSKVQLTSWENEGDAAADIIKAVTALDDSGFHGPYVLALAPRRYNLLFRRYRQGNQTEMQHVQNIVTDGIFKAPILKDGGLLLNAGKAFAAIVLGQDMMLGFVGPSEGDFEFSISESLALRIRQPAAICVLPA
jgi:uncharacterized linocin/CFP29 family protein